MARRDRVEKNQKEERVVEKMEVKQVQEVKQVLDLHDLMQKVGAENYDGVVVKVGVKFTDAQGRDAVGVTAVDTREGSPTQGWRLSMFATDYRGDGRFWSPRWQYLRMQEDVYNVVLRKPALALANSDAEEMIVSGIHFRKRIVDDSKMRIYFVVLEGPFAGLGASMTVGDDRRGRYVAPFADRQSEIVSFSYLQFGAIARQMLQLAPVRDEDGNFVRDEEERIVTQAAEEASWVNVVFQPLSGVQYVAGELLKDFVLGQVAEKLEG